MIFPVNREGMTREGISAFLMRSLQASQSPVPILPQTSQLTGHRRCRKYSQSLQLIPRNMDEFITPIVAFIVRMSLHPVPFDPVNLRETVQPFPQVPVEDIAAC